MRAYRQIRVGDPTEAATLMGPLIDEDAVENMMRGLETIQAQGGEILCGGKRLGGCLVEPTLVKSHAGMAILKEEIFAPVLHLIEFDTLEEAMAWHNDVPQGCGAPDCSLASAARSSRPTPRDGRPSISPCSPKASSSCRSTRARRPPNWLR